MRDIESRLDRYGYTLTDAHVNDGATHAEATWVRTVDPDLQHGELTVQFDRDPATGETIGDAYFPSRDLDEPGASTVSPAARVTFRISADRLVREHAPVAQLLATLALISDPPR